ncbi:unnamed protein product [Chrysodeixis includens]|uniref:C-type lectin domain-containing protein n=1 Tax=Chrysodeixis includens TaxID=689277 RepID=A0A9N8KUG5_CHRIL|nr:unnamed protein product [Chrysodeixis includens]
MLWCSVALLALFASVQGRAVNISNTWVLPEEGFPVFYRYFRDRISWYEADAVCQFHHANLVTELHRYEAKAGCYSLVFRSLFLLVKDSVNLLSLFPCVRTPEGITSTGSLARDHAAGVTASRRLCDSTP